MSRDAGVCQPQASVSCFDSFVVAPLGGRIYLSSWPFDSEYQTDCIAIKLPVSRSSAVGAVWLAWQSRQLWVVPNCESPRFLPACSSRQHVISPQMCCTI